VQIETVGPGFMPGLFVQHRETKKIIAIRPIRVHVLLTNAPRPPPKPVPPMPSIR
jgi:hypothetical protein